MAREPDGPGIARANQPGEPRLFQDELLLPSGRKVGAVSGVELTRELIAAGVPGVSHENGKNRNAEAYEAFLNKLNADASKDAFAKWRSAMAQDISR